MTWESLEPYQKLVKLQPSLTDEKHSADFYAFLDRMWTKPSTLNEFARAYMEFTTSTEYKFPKLKALTSQDKNNRRKSS